MISNNLWRFLMTSYDFLWFPLNVVREFLVGFWYREWNGSRFFCILGCPGNSREFPDQNLFAILSRVSPREFPGIPGQQIPNNPEPLTPDAQKSRTNNYPTQDSRTTNSLEIKGNHRTSWEIVRNHTKSYEIIINRKKSKEIMTRT